MSLLKIQPGEGRKTLLFSLIGLLANGGLTLGISVSDALFLSELGPDKLPYIYISLPLIMACLAPVSSYFQSHLKIETVVKGVLVAIAMGAVLIGLLTEIPVSNPIYPYIVYLGKLFAITWYIGLYTIFWNYVDAYFSISEGKRLYGIINAGSCVGIIITGSLLIFLSEKVSTSLLFYAWALTCLLAYPLVGIIQKHFINLEDLVHATPNNDNKSNFILDTYKSIKKSRFAALTALFYFLLPILTYTNEFFCFSVFSEHGDQQQITALFGQLYSYANILNLLISLFFFNYLVGRLGVRNIILIQPFVYFFVFLWYYSDLSFAAAIFGFFAYQTILPSIDNNNANLLFNALPSAQKRSIRTFIEGLGEPLSIALTGILLLYLVGNDSNQWLSLSAIGATALVAAIAYAINQLYVASILKNLKKNWFDGSALRKKTQKIVKTNLSFLQNKLKHASTEEEKLDIISLILRATPSGKISPYLMQLQDLSEVQQTRIHNLLIVKLNRARKREATALNRAIAMLPSEHWLRSKWDLEQNEKQRANPDPADLNDRDRARNLSLLAERLVLPSERRLALEQIAKYIKPQMQVLSFEVAKHVHLFSKDELIHCLGIIQKTKDLQSIRHLVTRRTDYTSEEKRLIKKLILKTGKRSVPLLLDMIRDSSNTIAARSFTIDVLHELSAPQIRYIWQHLLEQEIENLSLFHRLASAIEVDEHTIALFSLKKAYVDQRNQTLEWVLKILFIAGKIPNYLTLIASLQSENLKEQANGIEIIIEGVGSKWFKKIEPYVFSYTKNNHHTELTDPELQTVNSIAYALESHNELLVLSACHACLTEEKDLSENNIWEAIKNKESSPLLSESIRDYVASMTLEKRNSDGHGIKKLELIAFLHKHELFSSLKMTDLLNIIPHVEILRSGETAVSSTNRIHLPFNNDSSHQKSICNPVIELLKGGSGEAKNIPQTNDFVLSLRKGSIERIIHVYPEFGLHLLRLKMEGSVDA